MSTRQAGNSAPTADSVLNDCRVQVSGAAALYATGANNQQHVFYRGADGGIYDVFYDPGDNKIHGPER